MVATLDAPRSLADAPDAVVALLQPALDRLEAQARVAQVYQDYYHGLHRPILGSDVVGRGLAPMLARFRDNLSAAVVDAVADRLQVAGIAGRRPEDEAAAAEAWEIWHLNRLERRAGDAHLSALTSGDAFLVVWPDEGLRAPRITWTPATLMAAAYDGEEPERLAWAIKAWRVTEFSNPDFAGQLVARWRVNLFMPEGVYKLAGTPWVVGRGSTDTERPLPSATGLAPFPVVGESWPVPNPIAPLLPVVHLANNPAGEGEFGTSELRDVVPLADALNKSVVDLLTGSEFVAIQQRWVTGLQLERDPVSGDPINPFRPGKGDKLWVAEDPNVEFGAFPPADLMALMATCDSFRVEIARVTGTPTFYLGLEQGGWPSGEALKTAESRLVKKVMDRQRAFGMRWEAALALALRFSGREPGALELTWESPETRDERAQVERQLDVLAICRDAAPRGAREQALRDLGYSDDQVAAMLGPEEAPVEQPAPGWPLDALAALEEGEA